MTTRKPKPIAEVGENSPAAAAPKKPRKRTTVVVKNEVTKTGMSKRQAPLGMQDLIGRRRLTRMSNWDNEFMDAEVPAFIEFTAGGRGEFHFGYVQCGIDWEPEPRQGRPGLAFTFEGSDEMDPTRGRGWAVLRSDGSLSGRLYFHRGDDSSFSAKRQS